MSFPMQSSPPVEGQKTTELARRRDVAAATAYLLAVRARKNADRPRRLWESFLTMREEGGREDRQADGGRQRGLIKSLFP